MNENPSDKFFWNDWDNEPTLRLCSLAAQGLWMRMLCIASRADGYVMIGKKKLDVADIASYVGRPIDEISPLLEELERNGVYSVFRGTIYSRRIVKARKASRSGREHGLKGGNPVLRQPSVKAGEIVIPITPTVKGGDNPENYTPARVSPNSPNSPNSSIASSEAITDDDPESPTTRSENLFTIWWEQFPRQRRGSKPSAWKSWRRAVATGVDPQSIVDALALYLTSKDVADGFACGGDVWLNNERWNDQPVQAGIRNARPQRPVPLSGFAAAYAKLGSADYEGGGEASLPLLPSGP